MQIDKENIKEQRNNLIQWMVPALVLFGYFLIILVSYRNNMKNDAVDAVYDLISVHSEKLSNSFTKEIYMSEQAVQTTAGIIGEQDLDPLSEQALSALSSSIKSSMAVDGLICTETGKGISYSGESVDLLGNTNLNSCMTNNLVVSDIVFDQDLNKYVISLYAPIISNTKVLGAVCLKYPAERFTTFLKTSENDGLTISALMKNDGTLISLVGQNKPDIGENLYDIITDQEEHVNGTVQTKLKQSIQNYKSGVILCKYKDVNRVISYKSTGINGWYVIEIYTQKYIDRLVLRGFKPTKLVVFRILMAILIFTIFIVLISFINKKFYSKENRELQSKAETDLLTGLLNKMATQKHIQEYLDGPGKEEAGMLLLLDIDNFKKINDTMGHAFGDEVLSTLGIRLRNEFRVNDIVGRIGGDEFIVYLKNIKDEETEKREAARITNFFKDFKAGEYVKYSATASIGAAIYPKDGKSFEELYKAADKGVYLAKQRGKNQLAFYGDED